MPRVRGCQNQFHTGLQHESVNAGMGFSENLTQKAQVFSLYEIYFDMEDIS